MKAKEKDKLRRKLRTPDEKGIYHYPLPHSFFSRMISCLPPEEKREYWRLYDRQHLEGRQLSEKAQQRLHDLSERAHQLWDERKRREAEEPDTWYEELKARMWARHNAEQARKR